MKNNTFKTIFFPGWAMPPDKNIAQSILPIHCQPLDICDFGFFNPIVNFNFKDLNSELAKFADKNYEIAVGYSLGSQLALQMAAHYAGKNLRALILISAFAKFAESPQNPHGQKNSVLKNMINGMDENPSKVLKNFYQIFLGSLKSVFNSNSLIPNPSQIKDGLIFLSTCDASNICKNIKIPVLCIAGSDDTIVKPQVSEKLSSILPNCKLTILKGNHAIAFTDADKIKKIADEFIRQNIVR